MRKMRKARTQERKDEPKASLPTNKTSRSNPMRKMRKARTQERKDEQAGKVSVKVQAPA
jgi:hypothetical protein